MGFYLYMPKEVKELEISNSTTLGRTKGDHLFPNNKQISSLHCQITVKDNTVFIQDLNSTNGTFVNGKKIPTNVLHELKDESEITIGGLTLILKVKASTTSYQTASKLGPRHITKTVLPSNDEGEPVYAGFWIRLAARMIDGIILTFAATLFTSIIGLFFKSKILYLFSLVLYFAYEGFFLSGKWQATPGKMLFGLRVYKNGTESLNPLMAILRYILMSFSCCLIFGIFWIALSGKKRGLHDSLVGTSVRRVGPINPVGKWILILMMGPFILAFVLGLFGGILGLGKPKPTINKTVNQIHS
jgi:uncharacterized RDD family membrane protein YckC